MLKIDLLEDEELCENLNVFISSMLPHEKYDAEFFSQNLEVVLNYVKLEEFQLEYLLMMEALVQLNKLKVSFVGYAPRLTRADFESLLEVSIYDAVVRPELGVKEWLEYEGMDSNLGIQTNRERVCQKLCARALELYDVCFELEVESSTAINHEPSLRSAFLSHVSRQGINTQAEIIQHEVRVGRKKFSGLQDWLNYTTRMVATVRERLDSAESSKVVVLDSVESSEELLRQMSEFYVPIAEYGIPEIDAFTPILRHRLVVVVGKENVGKTKFAVDQVGNVLLAGGTVVYMCGESQKAQVYCAILINYVYKKFGYILRPEHIACISECPEDIRKILGMCIDELTRGGRLILADSFSYATLFDELVTLHDKTKFDMCVIDHSCALTGSVGDGSLRAKVDQLAVDCREFKKKYPVCMMVTSHPSTYAKDADNRGREINDSSTKGSQNLSTEADELFMLRDNEELRKQNLIMLLNLKRRDAGRVVEPVLLRKRFDASSFEYDASLQSEETTMSIEKAEALRSLEQDFSDEKSQEFSL